jgi:hypothetical protein
MYTDTRYGNRVFMGRHLLVTRSIYRNLMVDTEMEVCLQRLLEEPASVLSDLRASFPCQSGDGMQGDTPVILCNMCLGLDKLYSEPIDGRHESIRKEVNVLFMLRWNTFHAPVHSACFLMDKTFCHMEHDSAAKLELIQVIKDFCTVETADGTKIGRDRKVVKSVTEHSMQRSQ